MKNQKGITKIWIVKRNCNRLYKLQSFNMMKILIKNHEISRVLLHVLKQLKKELAMKNEEIGVIDQHKIAICQMQSS